MHTDRMTSREWQHDSCREMNTSWPARLGLPLDHLFPRYPEKIRKTRLTVQGYNQQRTASTKTLIRK